MSIIAKNSNRDLIESTKQLTDLLQNVITCAKAEGATDALVSVNQDNGFSVSVRKGEVETVSFNENKVLSLIVYIGQRKGGASSTDFSAPAIQSLVKAACDIAQVSATDSCYGLPDAALMTTEYPDLDLYHPWSITPTEAIEMARRCETNAFSLDKRICNSEGVHLSTHCFYHGFANTKGGEGLVNHSIHSIYCALVAKQGESMQRDYAYSTARYSTGLNSIEKLAERAVERTISRLDAKQIKTQKTPVLFSSRVSSTLFSSFINAISGGNLYRKHSFLLDSLGTRIFPKNFKIYEQPYLLRGLGSSPFDNEGVPTRENVFVEDGILQQYVLSSYSACRLNLKTTANCGGVHNLTIESNAGDLNDLLNKMDKGLFVTELMGQGVNILTGHYSRGANGFWVENGKIQYAVEGITIAGNLKHLFQSILAVGTDINPNITTQCGSVLIEQMTVAGY